MTAKTIVLIGQPNAGKSTLFNVLSDIKTTTSNFAGTTVKVKQTQINANGNTYRLVDLPGTYSLNAMDKAEQVTLDYLKSSDIALIINVVDSTNISRSLELTIELSEIGIPIIIALNMQDEAARHGIMTDVQKLSEILDIAVIPTSAVLGKGVKKLIDESDKIISGNLKRTPVQFEFTHHLEVDILKLTEKISNSPDLGKVNPRFFAIKSIENPVLVPENIISDISLMRDSVIKENFELHRKNSFEIIAYERHHLAMKIAEETTTFVKRNTRPFRDKIDDFLLHPILGYFFLSIFILFYFSTIFVFGSLLSSLIDIPLNKLSLLYLPLKSSNLFLWQTLDGAFMGISGLLGIVLPYFLPLLFLTSLIEDSGYLARIAFLIDGIMHKIGLHGKSVVPFILGFGCSIPAIYATRLIDNKKEKIIAGLLIPFIPCSARTSMIFALAAAITGPIWAIVIYLYIVLIIAINGKIMSSFYSQPIGLILEIPTMKRPSIRNIFKKTWFKINEFSRTALPFLVIGSIVLSWLTFFDITKYITLVFSPIIHSVLGLPHELSTTLVFGFFRKELILVMLTQAFHVNKLALVPMSLNQIVVFIIFAALYFPCFATFIVVMKEFGKKIVTISAFLSLFVATISALIFKLIFNI